MLPHRHFVGINQHNVIASISEAIQCGCGVWIASSLRSSQ
jgi:hypothetical protein